MLRLRGKPMGTGVALGSATVLRASNGIPMLPARMVAQMARAQPGVPIEPMEVILVAEEYEAATSLNLPWARVVGIAAERAAGDAVRRAVPTVIGLERLLESVSDDALLLIDGDRGVALVDPDGAALAAYQAERERIGPRRRLYLNYAHQPAKTLDGREVHVLARVETPDDVRAALEGGADALYVPADSPLVPADADDDAQHEALLLLTEAAAGKPITLAGDAESLSIAALLRAAARAEFTLAAPMASGAQGFADLMDYCQEIREALLQDELNYADIRMAGVAVLEEPLLDGLADYGIGRVVVEARGGLDSIGAQTWLDHLTAAAACLLLPVEVALPEPDGPALETALGLGAVGFIVAPEAVSRVKERVRTLEAAACRAALYESAQGGAE